MIYFQIAATDCDIFSGHIHGKNVVFFSTKKIAMHFGKSFYNPSFGIPGMQNNPFTHVFVGQSAKGQSAQDRADGARGLHLYLRPWPQRLQKRPKTRMPRRRQ